MANTTNTSGTLTATGSSTEDTLATVTTAASLQLHVDCVNMATDDEVLIKIYSKVLSGGTERPMWEFSIANDMDNIWVSPVIINVISAKFTLTQRVGTGRSFPWAVYQIG